MDSTYAKKILGPMAQNLVVTTADWTSLPAVIINLVFEVLPNDRWAGRLVCKQWRDAIEPNRNKTKLNLVNKEVSLHKVHQFFPNLKELVVQLHYNTEPSALFLWQSLDSVTIMTRTRIINGHVYSPTRLSIDTSAQDPESLQIYFFASTPISTCAEKFEGHNEFDLRRYDRNWELAKDEDGFKRPEYIPHRIYQDSDEEDNYDHTIHQCNSLCNTGLQFHLKGVGQRLAGSIVHQTFGVASKPHDWDAEEELFHFIDYRNILSHFPFYSKCSVMACELVFDPVVNSHLEGDEILEFLAKNVLALDATLLIPTWRHKDIFFYCQGRKVVTNCSEHWCTRTQPPLLPEHTRFEELVKEIEDARNTARQMWVAKREKNLEKRAKRKLEKETKALERWKRFYK